MVKYFVMCQGSPFEISLEMAEISTLYIHEETIPEVLAKLVDDFKRRKIIMHPVIVDKRTNVVLDGMHRIEAARRAGFKFFPVCKIDYQDPRVKLEQWYRLVKGFPTNKIERIISDVFSDFIDIVIQKTDSWIDEIKKADTIGVFLSEHLYYVVQSNVRGLWDAFRIFSELEKNLLRMGFNIQFIPDSQAKKFLSDSTILAPRPLTKRDVIKYARERKLFPRKTTRHVLPVRPLFLNVPAEFCIREDFDYVNKKFEEFIKQKVPVECKGHVTLDRFYEEETLLIFL